MDTEITHEDAPKAKKPASRAYVFAKRCTNDYGTFAKGDKARGAFSPELVASYLKAGVLTEAPRG